MISVFFVGSNSINPSYSVLYDELRRRTEPDLRVVDVSDSTPDEIAALCASSELVAVDNFIKVADKLEPSSINSVILDRWRGADLYRAVWDTVARSGTRILYIASGWDLHWPGPDLDELLQRIHAIAWMFEKKPLALADLPPEYQDSWMEKYSDPLVNWTKVRDRIHVRIELIHSLDEAEFLARPRRRRWDACVAGDAYQTRQIAQTSAARAGLRLAPFRRLDALILMNTLRLSRIVAPAIASRLRNQLRWANQRFLVSRSRVNFVCGSGYRYPVRKFLEVPSARSTMVCLPCNGFSDYGFVDGKNVVVAAPQDFGAVAKRLLANDRQRDRLEGDAWNTVRRLHSTRRRVDDLIECMRRISRERLTSAQFIGGEFEIA